MKKILVVDDDKRISIALSVRLKASGFGVACAFDGVQAVEMALAERPDLVIMDINMPAGGGITAAKKLEENAATRGTPVIFITASKEPELREQAALTRAVAFFEKPYQASDLVDCVKRTLGEAA